jgi:ubiquinone/menaquinone biosynthesis C-methylase UbiE
VNKLKTRNIFQLPSVAREYDNYYQKEKGKLIDKIEKKIIKSHLDNLDKGYLLELGCGTGHWTQFFCEQGFQVAAIDSSKSMLEIARSKNMKTVQFLNADAVRLPFPDAQFSAIASVTMLEFVDDLNLVLTEIDRLLKPGGTLLLGCLNALSALGENKKNDPVFKHAHFFTQEEIKKMLARFGNPRISAGLYFSPDFEILDGTKKQSTSEPAFIAASVKKTK